MPGGVDVHLVALGEDFAGERVELGDPLDVVAEELDAHGELLVRGLDLERVSADPELAAHQIGVRTLVLDVDEMPQHRVAPDALALVQTDRDRAVVDRGTQAVDARDRRDDDHVAPLEERPRRRVPHAVDLLVARAVLLDVGVAPGDVRLGLVVVVVRDEVLNGVLGEELLELAVELRGQCLVVREDQGGPAGFGDDLCHRHGLPRSGDATQCHMALARRERALQPDGRRRLVTSEIPRQNEPEGSLRSWPIERNLERLAVGHGCLILEQTFCY